MRFLNMLFGGLVGAVPGLLIFNFTGENILVGLVGFVLVIVGFIVAAVVGWKRSGWLSGQGVLGAVIGLVPGVILWQTDLDKVIVVLILIAGSLLGLFVGNQVGSRTTTGTLGHRAVS